MIQNKLNIFQEGRSCIIITHRLSSIQHVNQIYFINDGRVIETGTYEQLVQNPLSAFAQLIEKQTIK